MTNKIGLVGQSTSEVICADLIRGNQGILDQELRPLIK
jgi:hypothetical protein